MDGLVVIGLIVVALAAVGGAAAHWSARDARTKAWSRIASAREANHLRANVLTQRECGLAEEEERLRRVELALIRRERRLRGE